ncbi:MAG: low molecular weight protein arginine phosphatase [Phycisphaerales bacterium]
MARTILFVCTGNTCRSPMAAALARAIIEARPEGSETTRAVSAGVTASHGAPATHEAIDEMARRGLDLSSHRSRPLTPDMIARASLVLTMTHAHADAARRLAPQHASKIHPLDPEGDIPDPIGMGPEVYRQTADRLAALVEARLRELDR